MRTPTEDSTVSCSTRAATRSRWDRISVILFWWNSSPAAHSSISALPANRWTGTSASTRPMAIRSADTSSGAP